MVEMGFGGDDAVECQVCGTELPAFLDECPYCARDDVGYDEENTLPCPECGAEIYESSEQCPVCSAWVSMRVPSAGSSSWFTGRAGRLLVLALILALLWAFTR